MKVKGTSYLICMRFYIVVVEVARNRDLLQPLNKILDGRASQSMPSFFQMETKITSSGLREKGTHLETFFSTQKKIW